MYLDCSAAVLKMLDNLNGADMFLWLDLFGTDVLLP